MSALPSTGRATRPTGPDRAELRVVPRRRRRGRLLALFVAAAAAGVFGVVTLNALAAESAFAARELEQQVEELGRRYDELTAEVAGLESPERVREVATSELGMVPAEEPDFLVADGGGGDGPRRPAVRDGAVADPVKRVLGGGR